MYSTAPYRPYLSQWQFEWCCCQRILLLYHNRYDLKQLSDWAWRKRLPKPQKAYERKVLHIEQEIADLRMRYPKAAQWAYMLYGINRFVTPKPRYTKGYAAKYRSSNFRLSY